MADLKSFNTNPIVNSSTRRARMIGGAATAAATAVLALMVVLDFNGCSKASKNTQGNPSTQNSSAQNSGTSSVAQSQPVDQLGKKVEAVIAKKKAIKRPSTATYKNSVYGVSFRFPKTYTMLSRDKDTKESAWPDPVAMNFTEPGGETLTTLVLPGTRASSYFKASVNKGLTADQCSRFATTPEPTETAVNPPVDTADDTIEPVKSNVLGVEFAKTESVTEQSEARYYHHFENGACYEFALGVEDAPGTTKPIDHLQVFDKLERIMTTVKIKPDPVPVVATSEPATPSTPVSNPQQ